MPTTTMATALFSCILVMAFNHMLFWHIQNTTMPEDYDYREIKLVDFAEKSFPTSIVVSLLPAAIALMISFPVCYHILRDNHAFMRCIGGAIMGLILGGTLAIWFAYHRRPRKPRAS